MCSLYYCIFCIVLFCTEHANTSHSVWLINYLTYQWLTMNYNTYKIFFKTFETSKHASNCFTLYFNLLIGIKLHHTIWVLVISWYNPEEGGHDVTL